MAHRTADELLKWGIRHAPMNPDGTSSVAQVAADVAAGRRPDLADPGLYEAIMGKSEAQMMQEELAVATDASRATEDRCTALDNFEMLIEQVDNANNMAPMGMWPAVRSLLDADAPEIQSATAWVIGTAIQNNDKAQAAALEHDVLAPLLTLLSSAHSGVQNKCAYALSALLRHYPAAVAQFATAGGWAPLHRALESDNLVLRRKVVFLLTQLVRQTREARSAPAEPEPALPAAAPRDEVPATQQAGVQHPDVAQALADTGLLDVVLDSLLPGRTGPRAYCAGAAARDDEDYAQKATELVLAVLEAEPLPTVLPNPKLAELLQDLEAPAHAPRARALEVDETPLIRYLTL
ncbi:hsp70 nucleotide exchange factor fes1 [Malassezia caprae]|uniref:Hsp70 nucleotide exchange factor fes1 n=1 Tax=Malassezia caprae TaxID=1381934 RepID=A0AAF0E5C9_9BASI|nr:hsp70 nucleotide exchange factor fes1 [Malassezia caprae]